MSIYSAKWEHRKTGKIYRITAIALDAATLMPMVAYTLADHTGPTWLRPVSEFFDGRFRDTRTEAALDAEFGAPQALAPEFKDCSNCCFLAVAEDKPPCVSCSHKVVRLPGATFNWQPKES